MAHDISVFVRNSNDTSPFRGTTVTMLNAEHSNPLRQELADLFLLQKGTCSAAQLVESDIAKLGKSFDEVTFDDIKPAVYFASISEASCSIRANTEKYAKLAPFWDTFISKLIARRLRFLRLFLENFLQTNHGELANLFTEIEEWINEARKYGVPENSLLISLYGVAPQVNAMLVKGAPPLNNEEQADYEALVKHRRHLPRWSLATYARVRLLRQKV